MGKIVGKTVVYYVPDSTPSGMTQIIAGGYAVGYLEMVSSITAQKSSTGNIYALDDGDLTLHVNVVATVRVTRRVIADLLQLESTIRANVSSQSPRDNWVGWSKIGDIRLIRDLTNDAGLMPCEYRGKNLNVLQLGKNFIAYGDTGIAKFTPTDNFRLHLPPTFGMKTVLSIGIPNKEACCQAGPDVNYFIDGKGYLWKYDDPEAGPKNLGYKEFFMDSIHAGIPWVMSYDPFTSRLYICNGTIGYTLTANGLGGGPPDITSFTATQGWGYAFGPNGAPTPPLPEMVTDILDFETRDVKSVYGVQLGEASTMLWQAALDYRFDPRQPWQTTGYQSANQFGFIPLAQAGVEFRIRFKGLFYTYQELDYFTVHYHVSDATFKRIQNMQKEPK